tara:strand:- start:626 stop:1018 length:393 start_codon:yes stop_codon:yes gene_type:complete
VKLSSELPLFISIYQHRARVSVSFSPLQKTLSKSPNLGLLNSSCGEPLQLAGAWEWYDGVVFHTIHELAERGADAPTMLRGDPSLIEQFRLLEPLAMGTRGSKEEQAAVAAKLCAAAHKWQAVRLGGKQV